MQRWPKADRRLSRQKLLMGLGWSLPVAAAVVFGIAPARATIAPPPDQPLADPALALEADLGLAVLGIGDRGPAVETLQLLLANLGYGSTASLDGIYGAETAAAVAKLQAEQGQPSNGQVAFPTWGLLWAAPWHPLEMGWGDRVLMVDQSPAIDPNQPPPPSPLWLISMPAVPLVGGILTYWKRRLMRPTDPDAAPDSPFSSGAYPPMTANWVRYFPLIGLTGVSLIAFGSYVALRSHLSPPVLAALEQVADTQSEQLDDWFDQQRQAVLEAATAPEILPQIEILLTNRNTQDPEVLKAYTIFSAYLETLEGFGETQPEISLLTSGGIVVFATETQREGQYQPIQNTTTYFEAKQTNVTPNIYISPLTQALQITFATPVLNETDQRLGVLAIDLDLGNLDQQIREFPPLQKLPAIADIESRASYTVGRASLVKNQIIHGANDPDQDNQPTDEGVSSRGIDQAMAGISGDGLYLNYDKVPVLGVYRWAPRHNLALLVEVNQAEVFEPASRVTRNILAIGFTLTALISLVLSRRPPPLIPDLPSSDSGSPAPEGPPGVPDQQ
ncbi:MAG: cache domain-containing protein [Cyanobacteria bacterium]|nr:cache domain-containing protein [Cyanobacteriota bacterium]